MKLVNRKGLGSAALLAALCLPVLAQAAGSATLQTGNEKMQIYWQSTDTVRIGAANDKHFTLLKGGKLYSISQEDGKPQVIELGGMMRAMGKMAKKKAAESPFSQQIGKLSATGQNETIAGIKGSVYRVSGNAKDTKELVLSGDPLAKEFTQAYLSSLRLILGEEDAQRFMKALPDGKSGILRADNNFRLVSISSKAPSNKLFSLPAQPQDMSQMMQQMQQALKNMQQ